MKNFIVGMLVGVASGICVGAISVARNQKLSEKINSTIDSGEEKIKHFADKLKGAKNNKENCENNSSCPICS